MWRPSVHDLENFQLGPFQLEHPFILAPMAGITHSPFRRLMRKRGSALMISELISANGLQYSSERTKGMMDFQEDERVLGLQIFSEHEENLVLGAKHVESLGADFVDLNLGCPVPKIVKKGAGAAMCKDPARLETVLKSMVKAVRIPVTIKIRTGWDANSRNAQEVIEAAAQAGVAWVAVHGRTRAQGYSGEADWEFIGNLKAKASLPIIGNGDIVSPHQAVERYRTYGVDAVMIGRGALRNPFLFEQSISVMKGEGLEPPTLEDYFELMGAQRDYLLEHFEPRKALLHSRKFLSWYSAGFPGCSEYRRKVFTLETEEALWEETREFFSKTWQARSWEFLDQPFLMGGHG